MESLGHYLELPKKRGALQPPVFPISFLVLSLAIHCIALAAIDLQKSQTSLRQTHNFSVTIKQRAPSSENHIKESLSDSPSKQIKIEQKSITGSRARPPTPPEEQISQDASPPEPMIYVEGELDHPPEIIGELTLDPLGLIPSAIVGLMTIRLMVDESGTVVWSYVEQSDFSKEAEQQIVDEFKAARFLPAKKNGKTVKSLIQIEINRHND